MAYPIVLLHMAAELQAGVVGIAWEVEISGTVHVADANIFHRLRLDDNCVCSLGTGDSYHRSCGTKKHALEFHCSDSQSDYDGLEDKAAGRKLCWLVFDQAGGRGSVVLS